MMISKEAKLIFSVFFMFLGFLFTFIYLDEDLQISKQNQVLANVRAVLPPDNFSSLDLSAKSAIIFYPKENKVIYSRNANVQLPLASLSKIASAVVALELLQGQKQIPYAGELWNSKDLISFMLVTSSNDIAQHLKEYFDKKGYDFVGQMNTLAKKLGLTQSYFLNPSGLDESDYNSGNYGSAHDVAKLLYYAYSNYPEVFEKTTKPFIKITSNSGKSMEGKNTNKAIGRFIGFKAGKTGFTDLAGGNLAIIISPDFYSDYVIVVLGAKNKKERFNDAIKLQKAILKTMQESGF